MSRARNHRGPLIALYFADNSSVVVDVALSVVGGAPLLAHGDHNATRLSRLRWLDSTRWLDTTVSRKYQPVAVSQQQPNADGAVTTFLNRRVEVCIKLMNFVLKTRNFVSTTTNRVLKTSNFAFQMMNT